MEKQYLSIDTDIDCVVPAVTISREHNYKWIILVLLGFSMYYLQLVVDPDDGAPTMAILTLGIAMSVFGLVKIFSVVLKYHYNGIELKITDLDFDASCSRFVIESCKSGDFQCLYDVTNVSNSHVKLRILHDADFKIVYIQNFKFMNYTYEPCTEIRFLSDLEAQSLDALVKFRKK